MEEEIKSGELVVINNQGLAETTDDIISSAQKRVAQVEQIVSLALKRTNEYDWVDQNGKPYLTCSGAEKIARLFGISWKVLKTEKVFSNDEKGQFYFYEFTGEFILGKDKIETVGTCSSKDQFFAKSKGVLKPLSEIDETNIRKAAYSNMVVNGITRLLGIRNLTWEQVKKGGIDPDKVTKVKYNGGGGEKTPEQKQEASEEIKQAEVVIEKITQKQDPSGKEKWTKYTCYTVKGNFYTFDKILAEELNKFKGKLVNIEYKTTNYGNELLGLVMKEGD